MIRRRSFLLASGAIAAAPVLARLTPRPMAGEAPALAPLPATGGAQDLALRIAGWESPTDRDTDGWVQINSSWRATWR